jgi:Mn2+/Fe2+ NRAMP family transporter
MANIGITIAPWMLFFQQSFVVDKGMTEKDILFGKLDTASGALFTVLVAAFGIILTGTLLYKPWRADIESACCCVCSRGSQSLRWLVYKRST